MFKVGDFVTRKKYGNDIVFKIDKIENNIIYLKGIDVRLYASSDINDLVITTNIKKKEKQLKTRNLDLNEYFYIPGVILHLDSDKDYLKDCIEYYKDNNLIVYGYLYKESEFSSKVNKLISKHKPNIVVLTGHDSYNKKNKYLNSDKYIEAVKEIRKNNIDHNNLIIISGACQSNYEGLLKAGSTYASSPKRINIHSLDPAIIATEIALTEKDRTVNIEEILIKTHYGKEGIGGIKTNGMMYIGYPRKDKF